MKARRRPDGRSGEPLPRTKVLYVRVDTELHSAAMMHATRRGIGLADLARLALRDWLAARPELPYTGSGPDIRLE